MLGIQTLTPKTLSKEYVGHKLYIKNTHTHLYIYIYIYFNNSQ